ncbi:MAG: sulfotransferase [Flavobacteriales bacterium]
MIRNLAKYLTDGAAGLWARSFRMRPSVFIAGFQKCGTTTLYDHLASIPELIPGKVKEKNDLSFERFSMGQYLRNFPVKRPGKETLCGSHQLTYFPDGLPRLKEHFPDARVIVIMRDPVDRAFSLYQHNCRRSDDDKWSFREWVDFELELLHRMKDIEDPEELFHRTKWRGREPGSWDIRYKLSTGMNISRGLYYIWLQRMKELGIDFLPLCLEHYRAQPVKEMQKVLGYLGLPEERAEELDLSARNIGGYKNSFEAELEERLTAFFRPYNEKLFDLIGERYPWRS